MAKNRSTNKSKQYLEDWAAGCDMRLSPKNYISSASNILHKDYPSLKCSFFDDIYAWDADKYEHDIHGYGSSEAVDMVFAMKYRELLMVEAKLNVHNVENIIREIDEKIKHTRDHLVSSTNLNKILSPSIILFGQNGFHQLSNRFMKMNNSRKDIKPMTLFSFYNKYFEEITE